MGVHYGFAPGFTSFHVLVRRLFELRSGTQLVTEQDVAKAQPPASVHDFILYLKSSVTPPVGNLLLGAHANSAILEIQMHPKAGGTTSCDTLEDILKKDGGGQIDQGKSVVIPDELISYTSGGPPHFVHIKGCNLGKSRKLLLKLKEAFGGHVNVTALKYDHGLYPITPSISTYRGPVWEYMAYEFYVFRKLDAPVLDRAAALNAFTSAAGGTPVTATDLDRWLPSDKLFFKKLPDQFADPPGDRRQSVVKPYKQVMNVPLGVARAGRKTLCLNRTFEVTTESYRPFSASLDYSSEAERLAAFKRTTLATPQYGKDYPYPLYEQLGYNTVDEYLDGYSWTFADVTDKNGTKKLSVRGARVEYKLKVPITHDNGNVIFNFHPNAASGLKEIIQFAEDDSAYFETV